jgi:hypothetical protein
VNLLLYKTIRDNGGWNNWKMIVLEEYPCEFYYQQVRREQYWIDKLKPELNMRSAYTSEEDYKEYKKEYMKEYRVENAEQISEKRKEWCEANSEKLKEYQKEYLKEYQKENAEQISEYQKEYREENAEKIKQQQKEYNEKNKEKIKKQRHERYLKKKAKSTQTVELESVEIHDENGLLVVLPYLSEEA